MINEFDGRTIDDWFRWYESKSQNAIKNATNKIYDMICKFKDILDSIDKEQIEI